MNEDVLEPKRSFRIRIEDTDTMNHVDFKLDFFKESSDEIYERGCKILHKSMEILGYIEGEEMNGTEEKSVTTDPQQQDLLFQHPEETDNIQKSERPDAEYMKDRGLDQDTHGKKHE